MSSRSDRAPASLPAQRAVVRMAGALAAIAALVAPLGDAHAQAERFLTEGVRLPLEVSPVPDGVRGLEFNPAGLGFVDGIDAQFQFTHLDGAGPGSGYAGLVGARLFGALRFGVSAQYLEDGYGKLGFGLALAASDTFSIGYSYHGFVGDSGGPLDDVHTMDAGFVVRPAQWVSLSAAGRDLNAPRVAGATVRRTWELGVAFRPATWRVTLAGELAWQEDSSDVTPKASMMATPFDGVHLGAQAVFRPRDGELGVDVSASLAVDWSALTGEVGVFTGQLPGADFGYDGVSVGVRVTNQPRLSVHRTYGVWVDVTLTSPSEMPTRTWFGSGGATQLGTLEYLSHLAADPHVGGVLLRYNRYAINWAQAEELRDAIGALRDAGKNVVVYFDVTSTLGYYAAAGADKIIASPVGGVWLLGVASKVIYFSDFLSWIGVKAQFVRFGKYKSFPEAFIRTGPSEAANEVRNALLDGWADAVTRALAEGRSVSEPAARALFEGGPYTSPDAVTAGLIDAVAHEHEVEDRLGELFEQPVTLRRGYRPENPRWQEWGVTDRVAVLTVQGSIVDGRSTSISLLGGAGVGDETFNAQIDTLVANPLVRAIVLRVDSPGGSALASDKMYRKLVEAGKKKLIVTSMGSVAASGGYYIAAPTERIFAQPSTVTGSIGTFIGKFSVAELFGKLELHTEIWKRGPNSDLFLLERPWSDEQVADIERGLQFFYDTFVEIVAEGRQMTREQVSEVAQGRVWLGQAAKDAGLVDELGGLHAAVRYAANRVGFDPELPVPVMHLPSRSALDALRDMLLPSVEAYDEVGASAPEPLPEEAEAQLRAEQGADAWLVDAARVALGPMATLLPYAQGEPLYLLPFVVEWPQSWGSTAAR